MKARLWILLQGTFFLRHQLHQAVIDQGFHLLKHIIQRRCLVPRHTNGQGRMQSPTTEKHTEATKEASLLWIKQLIAPIQRIVQGLVTLENVVCRGAQEGQALPRPACKSLQNHWQRKHFGTRSSQFNCQGQSIQASANLRDGFRIMSIDLKSRIDGLCALDEEEDRWKLGDVDWIELLISRADFERRNVEFMLPVQAQNSPACHHDLQRRGDTQ